MPTDLELAIQAGAVERGSQKTDLQKAVDAGATEVSSSGPESGFLPFANRAIAGTLGAPVDLATAGLNLIPGVDIQDPVGGSEGITNIFQKLGIGTAGQEKSPEGLMEHAGAGVGEAMGFLLPLLGIVKKAAKAKTVAGQVAKAVEASMVEAPLLTATAEVTGGIGTGAGRHLAETAETPGLRVAGEVIGGIAGSAAPSIALSSPTIIGTKLGKTFLKKVAFPFTKKGSKIRAQQFLQKQVADPEAVAERVTAETVGELSPAIASGEKKLMALHTQFRSLDPKFDAKEISRVSHSIYQLEQKLHKLGVSAPEILQDVNRRRIASLEHDIDRRVVDAMGVADKKLSKLPVARRQSQESIIVNEELRKVMKVSKDEVDINWGRVDKDVGVDVTGTNTAYKDLIDDISQAERKDIPSILKENDIVKRTSGSSTDMIKISNVKEAQGLRSSLLEEARNARKDGKWNKARIAQNFADQLLEDMSETNVSGALDVAIASSRKHKARFERGIVGKILGFSKTGEPALSPDLTLETSIGRAGVKGSIDIDKIIETPEAISATRRYIARSFTDKATGKGTKPFDPKAASRWIVDNEEILDKFPDLRAQFQDINTATQFANETSKRMAIRRKNLQDPKISIAARFIGVEPEKAIADVFKSKNPLKTTKELLRQARKDPSGQATKGLQGAYIDDLLNSSAIGPTDDIGEQAWSGKKILSLLTENNRVYREVFTPEEMRRVRVIAGELTELETARGALKSVKLDLDDHGQFGPASLLKLVSRLGGARLGTTIARFTGGGQLQSQQIMSERFRDFAVHLNKDRAFQLVKEAIRAEDGGELLKTLLLPIDMPVTPKGRKILERINSRVSLWLVTSGSRVMRDIAEEMREDGVEPATEEERQGGVDSGGLLNALSRAQLPSVAESPFSQGLGSALSQEPRIIP